MTESLRFDDLPDAERLISNKERDLDLGHNPLAQKLDPATFL